MSEGVDVMFSQKSRNRHRLQFVETRMREVRDEQRQRVARAVDTMTSQHYCDETDPEAARALCEVMGQARQAGEVLDRYLDEWSNLRAQVA